MARSSEVNGPDFLGIGVSRAGTTYLYDRLRAHPQVWLPPLKELHFFDRDCYGWPAHSGRSLGSRLRLLLATIRRREHTWKSRADVAFALSYLRGNPDASASYRRYFPDLDGGVVRGEITPDYCDLDDSRIAEIKREFPDLKLLLTLRHPLHRFESQVCKYLAQTDEPSALSSVRRWLDSAAFVDSFDYAGIVARWRRGFGSEKLHVAYFEQLEEDFDAYFDDICRFLGISIGRAPEGDSSPRMNSSRAGHHARIPESLIRAFAEKVLPLYSDPTRGERCAPESWRRELESAAMNT